MRTTAVLCAVFLVAVAAAQEAPQQKDVVGALIQKGAKAYAAGDRQKAIGHLQNAITRIRREGARALSVYLSKTLPREWTGDRPQTQTGFWGVGENSRLWTQVTWTLTRKLDGANCLACS